MRIAPMTMPHRDQALMAIGHAEAKDMGDSENPKVLEGYATMDEGGLPYVQAFGIRVYYRRMK